MEFNAIKVHTNGWEKIYGTFNSVEEAKEYIEEEKEFDLFPEETRCWEIRNADGATLWYSK